MPLFEPREKLYRRYHRDHLVNGVLTPLGFKFPRQSVNRSKFSLPSDALEADCWEGKVLEGFGVLEFLVADIPDPVSSEDGREYRFLMKHAPTDTCYAHSEIWCRLQVAALDGYDEPPKNVKEKFRARLAQRVTVAIPAPE
ncbi:MAG TPA: hypothetical protein VEU62_05510 [Bryobacterales bacterium]|nr:hypothetical protein [Bryobacterales bacterium]